METKPNSDKKPVKQPLTPAQLQEREDRQPVPWNHWIRSAHIAGEKVA